MQAFRSIPFHVLQDHCCERRFKYLGVPGYYEVACSLARTEQCNLRVCPIWNMQNFPGPQALPSAALPANGRQPQPPTRFHQQQPLQSGGHSARMEQQDFAQNGQSRPLTQTPAPATTQQPAPEATVQQVAPAAPVDQTPLVREEPLAVEPLPEAGSLRDINLRLKETAPKDGAAPPDPDGRRPHRRPRGRGR